jgi:hypothetical protein
LNPDRNEEDELEGKTLRLRYNISRKGKNVRELWKYSSSADRRTPRRELENHCIE